jgi:hypothetical protein
MFITVALSVGCNWLIQHRPTSVAQRCAVVLYHARQWPGSGEHTTVPGSQTPPICLLLDVTDKFTFVFNFNLLPVRQQMGRQELLKSMVASVSEYLHFAVI